MMRDEISGGEMRKALRHAGFFMMWKRFSARAALPVGCRVFERHERADITLQGRKDSRRAGSGGDAGLRFRRSSHSDLKVPERPDFGGWGGGEDFPSRQQKRQAAWLGVRFDTCSCWPETASHHRYKDCQFCCRWQSPISSMPAYAIPCGDASIAPARPSIGSGVASRRAA